MIDILAFSDGHGVLPKIEMPFDLLLLAGDNVDLYKQSRQSDSIIWYQSDFVNWVNKLPFKTDKSKVLWIAGNHELGWQKLNTERFKIADNIKTLTNDRAIYLEDTLYTFENITIYGTPWCKIFGNWAFLKDNDALIKIYKNIPDNVDILLTHDAPYGTSDICFDWINWGRTPYSIGNEPLRDAIIEKQPKINLHGHLHSANHNLEKLNDTDVYCISLLNEDYQVAYQPLYLQL